MPVSHRRAPRVARDTTVYTNAPNRRREAQSSHLCTLLRSHEATRDTTVYTNAQNWRRKPRSSHLCTLSRPRGVARDTIVYTNAPNRCPEALTAHLCTLSRPRGRPRHNSVHKRPKSTRRGPILPSVYTIWPPGATHNSIVYTNAPKVQQKSHREFGTSSHLSCLSKNAAILSNGMASFPPPS